jgi:hypothetical protein
MGNEVNPLDLTEPQIRELKIFVKDIVEKHIERMLNKIWATLGGIAILVIVQGAYVVFIGGAKVQQISDNTNQIAHVEAQAQATEQDRASNAMQLSAIAANVADINARLTRIETKVDNH